MEEDKEKQAMASRLVAAMEPEDAKAILIRVLAGDGLYGAILAGGKVPEPERAPRKRNPRKPRSDKGKTRANDFGPVPPVGSLT
mgnify:CR=1 FL=1